MLFVPLRVPAPILMAEPEPMALGPLQMIRRSRCVVVQSPQNSTTLHHLDVLGLDDFLNLLTVRTNGRQTLKLRM
jgi:hypothetical protein